MVSVATITRTQAAFLAPFSVGVSSGRPVAVVANEFRFLGGSFGVASANRIVAAIRRATAEGLPLLATTSFGGTRMQEGTPAFVQMIDISRVIMDHKAARLPGCQAARLPYLVHLRHPTTGGVFASWGSLGHITVAEPDALIGFLGPKVYEVLNNRPFPPGIQVAENLAREGVTDAVVSTADLAELIDRALGLLMDPARPSYLQRRIAQDSSPVSTWSSITRTRNPKRPGVREVLRYGAQDTVRLQGGIAGKRERAVIVALIRLDGQPCVVIGQDRRNQSATSPMGPDAMREAQRGIRIANELGLPLVSFIDTEGAELSPEAEETSVAGEIANCIIAMASSKVPTVSVLLGQGCGGGALAFLPAERVIAAQNSWLAPLAPEGASAILYGDVEHAEQLAEAQKVGVDALYQAGTVHAIIPELDEDTETPELFAEAIAAETAIHLRELLLERADGAPAAAGRSRTLIA